MNVGDLVKYKDTLAGLEGLVGVVVEDGLEFHRVGVVIGIGRAAYLPVGMVEVVWTNEKGQWTTFHNPDSLVVLNENR